MNEDEAFQELEHKLAKKPMIEPLTTAEAIQRARHILANPHQMVTEGASRRVIAGLLVALDSGGVDGSFRQFLEETREMTTCEPDAPRNRFAERFAILEDELSDDRRDWFNNRHALMLDELITCIREQQAALQAIANDASIQTLGQAMAKARTVGEKWRIEP